MGICCDPHSAIGGVWNWPPSNTIAMTGWSLTQQWVRRYPDSVSLSIIRVSWRLVFFGGGGSPQKIGHSSPKIKQKKCLEHLHSPPPNSTKLPPPPPEHKILQETLIIITLTTSRLTNSGSGSSNLKLYFLSKVSCLSSASSSSDNSSATISSYVGILQQSHSMILLITKKSETSSGGLYSKYKDEISTIGSQFLQKWYCITTSSYTINCIPVIISIFKISLIQNVVL